jgi:hypothetical protein
MKINENVVFNGNRTYFKTNFDLGTEPEEEELWRAHITFLRRT